MPPSATAAPRYAPDDIPHRAADDTLSRALADLARHPRTLLLAPWNWKAAASSALIRGAIFLAANLRAGGHRALRAMFLEAVFAIFASGVMGAMTQRLRSTRPFLATAAFVWLAMPAAMLAIEALLHHSFGTPHLRAGLTVSFVMASVSSGFGWFAQRRGVLLAGPGQGSALADLRAMPALMIEFVIIVPRVLLRRP